MKKLSFRQLGLTVILVAAAACGGSSTPPPIVEANPTALVAGQTLGQWAEDWWSWSGSMALDAQHPLADSTGGQCGRNNQGSVWFLGGNFEGGTVQRICAVPAGTHLYFPLVNIEPNNFGVTTPETCQTLKDQAALYGNHPIGLAASLDGETFATNEIFHNLSQDCYTVTAVAGSPVSGTDSGAELAADNGYYGMLRPLTPGTHELKFKGGWQFNQAEHGMDETFSVDVTYQLVVAP